MASFSRVLVIVLAGVLASCTTKKNETPDLSGPSELGLSLDVQATPDVLIQDGRSESQVIVHARGSNGQPLANVPLRLDVAVDYAFTDFGQLSQKSVQTGGDGRAVVTYRAPDSVDGVSRGLEVQIYATPVGSNYNGQRPRFAVIRLVPPGTIGGEALVPDFSVDPEDPVQLETVTFDASDPDLDDLIVEYEWDFDDGGTALGRAVGHQFKKAGGYNVTLTVTDSAGRRGSRSRNVQVGASTLPIASFVFSPGEPAPGATVIFNGADSSATPPRTIVKYEWNFGDGKTATGKVASNVFAAAGSYNVTLTVTDDAGNKDTASQAVTVAVPGP